MSHYRPFPRLFLCLLAALALAPAALAGEGDWKPIDPAHSPLKTPAVEKDADAEAIFWEVRADDGDAQDFVLTNYIRIKIFTDRGRETQSTVELPYWGGMKIKDVAARTIKPTGQIVELKKEDIFDKTIVKSGGLKLKTKSFALPSVEAGSIVEYRWREVYTDDSAQYTRMQFQRDIPVQTLSYFVKPSTYFSNARAMRFQTFQMAVPQFAKGKNGFYTTTVENIPAFREEPRMPPEDAVRRWMLLYYTTQEKIDPAAYWKQMGKVVHGVFKDRVKINDDVKRAAAEIVGDAQTPEQKLERLYDFCRLKIKNLSDDASPLTDDDRAKIKKNDKPADTLKRAQGTASDIDELFATLAVAAGFDARLALMADRSRIFFDPASPTSTMLRGRNNIAVKVGEEWRFFEPSDTYVPYGMLAWPAENQQALISDPKEPIFVKTPLTPPAKSLEKRAAKLRLLEDGTLEGDVRVEYTGHVAYDKKEYNDEDSPQRREETLRETLKAQMSTIEVSDIKIENVTDPQKPFVYAYKVRVPGYAQRTGKRLFLQPAFFQHGRGPAFSAADRRNEIYFHYPWSEDDTVEIELPAGFALDNADAPVPMHAGVVSKYDVTVGVTNDNRKLVYHRSFYFGGGDNSLRFPVASYASLKQLFDEIHKRDNHTITLKQDAAAASNTPD